jgi:hypothetical protein
VNGEKTRVVPLLIDMQRPTDLTESTLSQFHAVVANKDGFKKLAHSLNNIAGEHKRTAENLDHALDTYWGQMKNRIDAVPRDERPQKRQRGTQDMVAEVLTIVRSLQRKDETVQIRAFQRKADENNFAVVDDEDVFRQLLPEDLQEIKRMVIDELRSYVDAGNLRFRISKGKNIISVYTKGHEVPREVSKSIQEKVHIFYPAVRAIVFNPIPVHSLDEA